MQASPGGRKGCRSHRALQFWKIRRPTVLCTNNRGGSLNPKSKFCKLRTDSRDSRTPYIIYSPDPLTVTEDGEETVIIPAKTIESLTTVESSLTEGDIDALIWAHEGESYLDSLGTEDYVNIALALIQHYILAVADETAKKCTRQFSHCSTWS
jgi:hypothetical protein